MPFILQAKGSRDRSLRFHFRGLRWDDRGHDCINIAVAVAVEFESHGAHDSHSSSSSSSFSLLANMLTRFCTA